MMDLFKNRKRIIYDRHNNIPYLIRYYLFLKERKNFPFNITLHKILVSHAGPIISESGINTKEEVEEIVKKTKIKNFLIGESLLKDIDKKASLLKNIVKISL